MALDPGSHASEVHRKASSKGKKVPQAHKNQVVSLSFTHDGLWILTYDSKGELKLWNSSTGKRRKVSYGLHNNSKRSVRMAVTPSMYPDLVFVPSLSKVYVLEILTGQLVNILEGHLASVCGVLYNPASTNLYTFGSDHNFITWTPKVLETKEWEEEEEVTVPYAPVKRKRVMQDSWSSDED